MANDSSLQPVFPPAEANCSAEALQAADAVLDDETRAILAADRARLTQATVLASFTLAKSLGLSETTTHDLQARLVDRVRNLSPPYHDYVNRLLGGVATTFSGQMTSEQTSTPYMAASVASDNGHSPLHDVSVLEAPHEVPAYPEPSVGGSAPTPDANTTEYATQHHENGDTPAIGGGDPPEAEKESLAAYDQIDWNRYTTRERIVVQYLLDSQGVKHSPSELRSLIPGSATDAAKKQAILKLIHTIKGDPVLGRQFKSEGSTVSRLYWLEQPPEPSSSVDGSNSSDSVVPDDSPSEAQPTNTPSTEDSQFDPADIISLPEGVRFFDHPKTPFHMRKFLSGVLPNISTELTTLTPRVASLLTFEVLRYYREEVDLPRHTTQRKEVLCSRIASYVGLNGPVAGREEFEKQIGATLPSYLHGAKLLKEALRELLPAEELLRRAITTRNHTDTDDLFTVEVHKDGQAGVNDTDEGQTPARLAAENATPASDTASDNGGEELTRSETKDLLEAEPVTSEAGNQRVELRVHPNAPASMRNFLVGVYPAEFGDRLLGLSSVQASLLTYKLIETYRDLATPHLTDEAKAHRCSLAEQWTGLYGEPRDKVDLALHAATLTTSIENSLQGVIRTLGKRLRKGVLKEMYTDVAANSGRPRITKT